MFWGAISGPGIDATNGEAIWMLEADGTLHTVARTGDAPDADAPADRYVDLNRFTYGIDGLGRLVFTATLAESGRCIFVGSAESLQRVACAGDDALGVGGGVWFTSFEVGKIAVDGQLAIQAHIGGAGVTSANNLGIWMAQSGGELELVFRGEEAIEVRPDDYRVLRTFGFEGLFGFGGGENGWPRKFNDLGQYVSWVSFEDRSQGIIIATLSSDSDGDGIDDAEDTCPEEDATGLDADGDGCIDRLADLPTLIENRAGIGASVLRPMLSMATGALRLAQSGRARAARNQLSALAALIKAQTGKKISVDDSVLLRSFIANVVQHELL